MRCSYAQRMPAAAGFIICAALQFYTSVVAHIRIFVIAFLIDFARFAIYESSPMSSTAREQVRA